MEKDDLIEIIAFNQQQAEHIRMVQHAVHQFCCDLMRATIEHDLTKWDPEEYSTFVASRQDLNKSKDGKDKGYQQHYQSSGIQHHVNNNKHHPEYWDTLGQQMPLQEVIIMFMDWWSRSKQRKTDFGQFWDYNLEKLSKQPAAKAIVTLLRDTYAPL